MRNRALILCSVMIMTLSCSEVPAQNIGVNKKYTVSEKANYRSTGNKDSVLNDGYNETGERFWQKETTVGWQKISKLEISIDLEKSEDIGIITFNTARGINAEVYYPKHVFVFVSVDNKAYKYVDDLMDNENNTPGAYEVRKFKSDDLNVPGRFIKLVVIPQGKYIFCDEFEVFNSSKGVSSSKDESLNFPISELPSVVDNLIALGGTAKQFGKSLKSLGANGKPVLKLLKGSYDEKNSNYKGNSQQEILTSEFFKQKREILKDKFDSELLVDKVDLFERDLFNVAPNNDTEKLQFKLDVPIKGHQFKGVQVTNNSEIDKDVFLEIKPANNKKAEIKSYFFPFISSRNMQFMSDPIEELRDNRIKVKSGETVIFGFLIKGLQPGHQETNVSVRMDDYEKDVAFSIEVVPLPETKRLFSANVWAYLDYPLLTNREQSALKDLSDHYINTTAVRSRYIPKFTGNPNYQGLLNYINKFPRGNKVLLFANWKNKDKWTSKDKAFMSSQWKTDFKIWYNSMKKKLIDEGFSADQIYWYPYDEVEGKDVDDLIKFSKWAEKEIPELNLFVTVISKKSLRVLPYVDIAQIKGILLKEGTLPKTKAETWVYEVFDNARDRSAYSDYRLMAWKAILNNLNGVGFWNYADNGKKENLITSSASEIERDYSVIYTDGGKNLLSSRRWEAFRMGIEDARLLRLYSELKGRPNAEKLIKRVLSEPEKTELADQVREEILDFLKNR